MRRTKWISLVCAGALLLTLAGCGRSVAETEEETTDAYDAGTYFGQVTEVSGSSVTLELWDLSEVSGADSFDGSDVPSMPGNGEDSLDPSTQGDMTPPATDGDSTGVPEAPSSGSSDFTDLDPDSDMSQPPEKPEGESDSQSADAPEIPEGSGSAPSGEVPEKPDGDSDSDSVPGDLPDDMDLPEGEGGSFASGGTTATFDFSSASITKDGESIQVTDLAAGDYLQITIDEQGIVTEAEVVTQMSLPSEDQTGGGGQPGAPDQSGGSTSVRGSSAATLTEDGTYSNETYTSTGDDENALCVDGAAVTLDGITVDKSAGSSSSTEDGDFFGINAALLATNGAQVTITNATVTSSAQNGNGVFSYGDGTVVTISDSEIHTTADNSGGIQTTGGGTTYATNLTVTTEGSSSAAIRSDRGGGTVVVDGGTYTSSGYNSPAVYSTADITVSDATLTANNSEALVIEGQNSITLTDCDVSGNMSDTQGTSSDENVHNVMIYQSMSGDADVGQSSFSMTGGTLTSLNGDLFYVTNTSCTLDLSGVTVDNREEDGYFLRVSGNSGTRGWGSAGSNGAQVVFTAQDMTFDGDILVDTISTLTMELSGNTTFTGTVNITDNAEGGTAVSDNAVVTVDAGSVWNLTGNCTLTSLTNNGTINFNGYTITLADGTVLNG